MLQSLRREGGELKQSLRAFARQTNSRCEQIEWRLLFADSASAIEREALQSARTLL